MNTVLRHLGALALGLLCAGAAMAQPQQTPPTPGVDVSSLVRLTIGLAVVLGAVVGLAWLLRRYGRFTGAAAGQLKLLGGLSLGNRERIVLVQAGDTQLLVGVAPGRVQTLHVLETPIEAAAEDVRHAGQGGAFAQRLRGLMQQGGKS